MPSNDPFAPIFEHYCTPLDIGLWVSRCAFSNSEAAKALEMDLRQFYRWKEFGLPQNHAGRMAARLMDLVEKERAAEREYASSLKG